MSLNRNTYEYHCYDGEDGKNLGLLRGFQCVLSTCRALSQLKEGDHLSKDQKKKINIIDPERNLPTLEHCGRPLRVLSSSCTAGVGLDPGYSHSPLPRFGPCASLPRLGFDSDTLA